MKTYIIRDSESGNVIEEASSYQEAKEIVARYEEQDKKEVNFTKNFYEILEE